MTISPDNIYTLEMFTIQKSYDQTSEKRSIIMVFTKLKKDTIQFKDS